MKPSKRGFRVPFIPPSAPAVARNRSRARRERHDDVLVTNVDAKPRGRFRTPLLAPQDRGGAGGDPRWRSSGRIGAGALLMMLCLLGGCAALKPSVKPYEREVLADPLMSISRDPLSDKYIEHVYEVREAAQGGGTGQGGGCGCN